MASGRVAKEAAVYPDGLCRAIIRGTFKELLDPGILNAGEQGMQAETDDNPGMTHVKNSTTGYSGKFKDDLSGQLLRDDLVMAARKLELDYFTNKGVWNKVPRQQAFAQTGRPPIGVRWVDVNKRDDLNPNYRARIVARRMKAMDTSAKSFSPRRRH